MDITEIHASIGLMYARGLLGNNTLCVSNLLADKTGDNIFGPMMSEDRFKFLTFHITVDEEDS